MSAVGLTSRQRQLLVFIDRKIRETGVCPSIDEMVAHTGQGSSKAPISRLLNELQQRGWIHRERYKARSIAVLRPVVLAPRIYECAARAALYSMGAIVSSESVARVAAALKTSLEHGAA